MVLDEKLVPLLTGSDPVTFGGVTSLGPPVGVTIFAHESAKVAMKNNIKVTNLFDKADFFAKMVIFQ